MVRKSTILRAVTVRMAGIFALALMVVLTCFCGVAYADDTVEAGNGWSLSYEMASGKATITGVATVGSGELTIPSSIGDTPVTALKTAAFRGATMTSVYIPSSVEGVSSNCFRNCASLKTVTFEGDKTGYFGPYSFAGCTAIEKFVVPVLTSTYSASTAYRIADNSFLDCTALKTMEFLVDNEVRGAQTYFTNYNFNSMTMSLFGSNSVPDTFVFYGKRPDFMRWSDTTGEYNRYYTVDFYASKEDAADYGKKVASVTCKSETPLADILSGTMDSASLYKPATGSIPALPSGKVWGVSDYGRQAMDWGLYDSYSAYPVDATDLEYAWVTSPEIKALTDQGLQDTYWAYARAEFKLNSAGTSVPGLAGIVAQSSDGSTIDAGQYTLEYQKRVMGESGIYTNDYQTVSSITSPGQYRVRAVASGSNAHAGSATDYIEMIVSTFGITTNVCATVADAVFSIAGTHAGASSYSVVVPDGSWQYALIGAGLAAAGNGVAVPSGKDNISNASLRAIVANGADTVLALGGGVDISQSVISKVNSQSPFASGGGTTSMTASSVQTMAVQAYNNIVRYGSSRFAHAAAWGDSAVVVSPQQPYDAASVALYAYAKAAPVFFTNANGSLPSDVASILQSGAFKEVVVAGSAALVPDSTLSAINGYSGVSAKRVLAASTSGDANREFASQMVSELGFGSDKAVIASISDSVNAVLGAQAAVDNNAALYTCASTADGKALQKVLDNSGVETVWLVGDFASTDSKIADRIDSIASDSPLSTAIASGDTVQSGPALYTVTGSGKVTLTSSLDKGVTSLTVPASVSQSGTAYSVTSIDKAALQGLGSLATFNVASKSVTAIPASAFAGLSKLKSVSYAAAVKSIGNNAFNGCKALTTLNANVLKANTIGSSAFKDCKSLKKLAFTSTKTTAISANAFQNCTKLTSLSFASTAIKKIGANALSGSSKLKTIALKTTKLTAKSVGNNAFKNIAKKATVKVPKKKVSSYAKIFKSKGLPAGASVKSA